MQFEVVKSLPPKPGEAIMLVHDNWDDYFSFETLFGMYWRDSNGSYVEIGAVKIAQFNMGSGSETNSPGLRSPNLEPTFTELGPEFFSLGQDVSYYHTLQKMGTPFCHDVLRRLNDIAYNKDLLDRAKEELVTKISLLRNVPLSNVIGEYYRLLHSGDRDGFKFVYFAPPVLENKKLNQAAQFHLKFEVKKSLYPPTNLHVLIGRNGVGKTRTLDKMTRALVQRRLNLDNRFGEFRFDDSEGLSSFDSLVSVAFSAFDPFAPLKEPIKEFKEVHYCYVGLKHRNDDRTSTEEKGDLLLKRINELTTEFVESLAALKRLGKLHRLKQLLIVLDSDPIFAEACIDDLADSDIEPDVRAVRAASLFSSLSSGHKIVLLTITRLVEFVQEKTMVLLDEPEAHLHPPLLSALIRAISQLLVSRNGIGIIATHSPVVLQEVPRQCVNIMERSGDIVSISSPRIETFGENAGILTQMVFGLELTSSGFHDLIRKKIKDLGAEASYETVLDAFGKSMGSEATAVVRMLLKENALKTEE